MNQILQISSDPLQKKQIILPDGSSMNMTINFIPLQYGWFINELTYGKFKLQGVRIFNSYNILHQFRNQISFGIACITSYGSEPTQREDFSRNNSRLYVLSSSEVAQYGSFLSVKV